MSAIQVINVRRRTTCRGEDTYVPLAYISHRHWGHSFSSTHKDEARKYCSLLQCCTNGAQAESALKHDGWWIQGGGGRRSSLLLGYAMFFVTGQGVHVGNGRLLDGRVTGAVTLPPHLRLVPFVPFVETIQAESVSGTRTFS